MSEENELPKTETPPPVAAAANGSRSLYATFEESFAQRNDALWIGGTSKQDTPATDLALNEAQYSRDPFGFMVKMMRRMERERDAAIRNNNRVRADLDAVAEESVQLQDALGCPCEMPDAQAKAMERIRDLIAAEGELGDLKALIREEVLCEIYNQHGQNSRLIERVRAATLSENVRGHRIPDLGRGIDCWLKVELS